MYKLKGKGEESVEERASWGKGIDKGLSTAFSSPRYRDTIAGRDFEKLMNDSGVREEAMDDLDDLTDADYRHQGASASASPEMLMAEAAAAVVATVMDEEPAGSADEVDDDANASIIISDASGPPSDLPVSVNIEVNFQEGELVLLCMFALIPL